MRWRFGDGCGLRGRSQRENLYARRDAYTDAYTTDELKISYSGRTNRRRGRLVARTLPESARIFIRVSRRLSTLFSVLPAAPRLDTIGVTQAGQTKNSLRDEKLRSWNSVPTTNPFPSSRFAKLSHTSLSLFFPSLFPFSFFFFLFFRFYVAFLFLERKAFSLTLYTVYATSICY